MSDAQIGALITAGLAGIATIAAAIKWGIGRIAKAWDDQTAALLKLGESQVNAATRDAEMRATMMQGMNSLQRGMEQILQFLFTGRAPERSSMTPVGLHSIEDESGEFTRPGADRRRRAQTPLQIPRARPQHHDDNE